ncbi:Alpha/Beta hydrolase protein [Phascolomyces articulosus]|uniref:Alpha/Beta hydrolase protein n=1 Tax=Phascolomyces articulosus TaxID=60185 RepID=A0AAD5P9B3_9FUNG|nr:Alpha/Beta hydrolase protein [Phascolomyces articulosus]
MASKQQIPVAGLQLTVYGLDEYRALNITKPVAIMFALHGRLQNMSKMEKISQALCSLNGNNSTRHMIVITFDHPNHGSRLTEKLSNYGWEEGKQRNPYHAQDMWTMYNESSKTVSALIDVVEDYLFGPTQQSRVQAWGVIGFSMGGHSTFMAAANDPRISVAIPIVGTADFLGLLTARLKDSALSEKDYLPQKFSEIVKQRTARLDQQLKGTKLLMINGQNDKLVPSVFNHGIVSKLRTGHTGKQGQDWDFVVVPECGHEWHPVMFDLSRKWCQKWMLNSEMARL